MKLTAEMSAFTIRSKSWCRSSRSVCPNRRGCLSPPIVCWASYTRCWFNAAFGGARTCASSPATTRTKGCLCFIRVQRASTFKARKPAAWPCGNWCNVCSARRLPRAAARRAPPGASSKRQLIVTIGGISSLWPVLMLRASHQRHVCPTATPNSVFLPPVLVSGG